MFRQRSSDEEKRIEIGTNLCRKFTDDEAYLQRELENALPRALLQVDFAKMKKALSQKGIAFFAACHEERPLPFDVQLIVQLFSPEMLDAELYTADRQC